MKTTAPRLVVSNRANHPLLSGVTAVLIGLLTYPFIVTTSLFSSAAWAEGERDPNFNSPARYLAFRPANAVTSEARAVALQADRKIVVAGTCDGWFCVGRLLATGELDLSFSGPGNAQGVFQIQVGDIFSVLSSHATALAIQRDGKIVIAGYCVESGAIYHPCLARLNVNGTYDPTFRGPDGNGAGLGVGTGGGAFLLKRSRVSLNTPLLDATLGHYLPARGVAMALQADGKIVIGHSCVGAGSFFCIARLNPDGSFDTGFDGPERSGNGSFSIAVAGIHSYLTEIAIQPSNGHILAIGTCAMSAAFDTDFCLTRLLPTDGTFDPDFDGGDNVSVGNGNGRISISVGSENNFATSVAFTPNGFILVAGACTSSSRLEFCAGRLDAQRGRYATFSGSGFPGLQLSIGTGHNVAHSVAVQSDGRFVLIGVCDNSVGTRQFCATRYHHSGVIDVSYDGEENVLDGKFLVPSILTDDFAYAQAMQWDDMSVVVGRCQLVSVKMFCVTRLLNATGENARPARTCDLDLDGDGRILATVDGLILTRIMLGFNDSTVLSGITINQNASRSNWTSIRRHLVERCGLPFLRLD